MSEQLPYVRISAVKTEERVVVEINLLLFHLDAHPHGYMLESCHQSWTHISQVVVPQNKIDASVQTVEETGPLCASAQTEVAQMEDGVVFPYHAVPILHHRFVHFLDIRERTLAEFNDITVIEVSIRGKEQPISIKLEIQFFVHYVCLLNEKTLL
jgi:hypothetical protein